MSAIFGGRFVRAKVALRILFSVTDFFINSSSPMVLGPCVALLKYIVLPFLPCDTTYFQVRG